MKKKAITSGVWKPILFAILACLMIAVLVLSAITRNRVERSRPVGLYSTIEDLSWCRSERQDAPTGTVEEYRFTLKRTGHADTLAFYVSHYNIRVYLGGEEVYSVEEAGKYFRTTGGVWVMVPLLESDSGKEICVELAPLYENYQEKSIEFLLGSELGIYRSAFLQALPELILCLCVVLVGLFLLCVAIYLSAKHSGGLRIYAIALLSIFSGVWRFTYSSFTYLVLSEHSILIYNLSILSLMLIALAMLNCVELPDKSRLRRALRLTSLAYCLLYALQLLLQLTGLADLRQMLKLTHVTLIVSAAVICTSGVAAWVRRPWGKGKLLGRNYSWLLGIGTISDLLFYYFYHGSSGMRFTLVAVLCFGLLEGASLFIGYMEQKNTLKEMETQLTLSRTMTMMSQIRSHFVFNILNAISGMCKYDPEMADDTVVRFARYLRSNIDIMENDKNIPFATELRHLEDYVVLEQVRFGDKLEFCTDIETDDFLIPPLILQPVVENAIKHGVSKKLGNGTIFLRTCDLPQQIDIIVEDDGVGFDMKELEKESSVGLRNIRFRLEHLVNGHMKLESEIGKGSRVTITIPKKEKESQ